MQGIRLRAFAQGHSPKVAGGFRMQGIRLRDLSRFSGSSLKHLREKKEFKMFQNIFNIFLIYFLSVHEYVSHCGVFLMHSK